MTKRRGSDRRGRPTYDWSQAATDTLIRLKRQGATRSQIARTLESEGHGTYSPEAVCGKVFRLRRQGISFARDYSPTIPTVSTGLVLGTFLERLCDVGAWT